jgi:hypothetical protein
MIHKYPTGIIRYQNVFKLIRIFNPEDVAFNFIQFDFIRSTLLLNAGYILSKM